MPVIRTIIAAALCAPLLLTPAAGARSADCKPATSRSARSLALVLPDGTRLAVRDPYGGVLPRSRRTFRFVVSGSDAALARAGTVRWYLDDERVARTDVAPFAWSGGTASLPAGRHTVTVQAEPADGEFATTSFTLRVARCAR